MATTTTTDSPVTAPRPSALRRAVPLLLIWMALPAMLRVPMLVEWLGTDPLGGGAGALALGVVLGLAQDGFIALQALVAMLFVRRLTGRGRGLWIWTGCAAFALFSSYALIDFLLYQSIDLRMTASFFHFFLDAEVFMDSVDEVGVRWVLGGLALLLAACVALFWRARPWLRPVELGWPLVLGGCALGAVAVGGALYGPGELMYMANNVALADQIETTKRWLGVEDDLLRHASALDGDTPWVPEPSFEHLARRAPKSHPLWRETRGFTGDTLFDVRLAPGERPHVVVLVLESFRGVDVGALGGRHGVTPEFDRLAGQGVLFTSFYAAGVQTTRAVISVLFGILPRYSPDAVQAAWPDIPLTGLADVLAAQGYSTAYLHNGELDFESMGEFFAAQRFETIVGEHEVEAAFPGAARFSWGVHDEYLMDYALDWLERQDATGQPAFATMFTISNHHPWELPAHWDPIDLEVPADTTHGKFLRAMHYSDHCLGRFVDGLRQRGLSEKTIVLVLADTSQAMGERNGSFAVSRNLYQENVSVPLLVLADGRLDAPRVIDLPGSQADVLPTVMDLLGIGGEHHSFGSSLRRRDPERMAFFASPFALGYWGLRHGRYKYFYVLRAERHHLYDLTADPGERHNLADAHPERVERYFSAVARAHRLMDRLYDGPAFRE